MWHIIAPASLRYLSERGWDAPTLKKKARTIYRQMVERTPSIGGLCGNSLHIGVEAYLEIVTSKAAHVLDNDGGRVPGLYLGNHGLEAVPVEGRAAHSIVREVPDVGKAVPLGIVL